MKIILGALIVLLLALQYQLWFSPNGYLAMHRLHQRTALQVKQNHTHDARNGALEKEIQSLKQGKTAVEKHAREDLGWIKPGETYYQIVKQPQCDRAQC